jgi:hypothetical protein
MDRIGDNIVKTGDATVESCLIYPSTNANPYDLTAVWMTISIYESIGVDYIRMEMTFTDTQNLIERIPIITNEKIIVKYRTDSLEETQTFVGRITAIPVRKNVNQGTQIFALEAITEEFVFNQKVKFSKSYNKMLISDMVFDIFEQYVKPVSGKEIAILPTLEQESKVIPNYSPMRAINWLTKWARSPKYRSGASYVFYQNKNNFYFGPVEDLIDPDRIRNAIPSYTYTTNVMNQNPLNKDMEANFRNIINYTTKSIAHVNMMDTGTMASSVVSHDLVTRKIYRSTYNYFENFEDNVHLESFPITNETQLGAYPLSRVLYSPEHYGAFGGEINSNRNQQTASNRYSQIGQLKMNGLEIVVPGDSNRTIGEVVNVELPSIGAQTKEDTFADGDAYLSGKYLVWNLKHDITRTPSGKITYFNHMRLYRDSNRQKLPDQVAFPFGTA